MVGSAKPPPTLRRESLLQHLGQERVQFLRRQVVRLSQVGVDGAVGLALGGDHLCFYSGLNQLVGEPLRLGFRFGSVGHVKEQKRRDILPLGDVSRRGTLFLCIFRLAEQLTDRGRNHS